MDDASVLLHCEPDEGEGSDGKGDEQSTSDFSSKNLPRFFRLEFLKSKTKVVAPASDEGATGDTAAAAETEAAQ